MRSRLASLAAHGGLVAAGTVGGLLLLEAGVRLLAPQPLAAISRSARLGWVHRPNSDIVYQRQEFRVPVHFSSAGLRDREYPFAKPPGTTRLAILGDSFVEAVQVPLDSCMAKRTEAWLNAHAAAGRRYEVLNCGVSGYGTCQQLLLLEERVLRFHPDLVVSQYYANDPDDDRRYGVCELDGGGRLRIAPAEPLGWRERAVAGVQSLLLRHSHLWVFASTRRPRVLDPKAGRATAVPEPAAAPDSTATAACPGRHHTLEWSLTLREPTPEVEHALAWQAAMWERMAEVASRNGARFLVVLGVSRNAVDPRAHARSLAANGCLAAAHDENLPRLRLRAAAAAHGIDVLDLEPAFAAHAGSEPLHYRWDGHWTAAGHRVAARALCGGLARRGILDGGAPTRRLQKVDP